MGYLGQFLLCAVLTVMIGAYVTLWARAYRIYKAEGDALHLILLTVSSVIAVLCVHCFSLTLS